MDGTRRYRFVWIEAPRKSGKTTFSAAISLYMLLVDAEPAADICITGCTLLDSSSTMSIIRSMIQSNKEMAAVCSLFGRFIKYKNNTLGVFGPEYCAITGRRCFLRDIR